jgi:hypothetical protein
MTFTNPAVFWALPLGAIPLLLHLLSRRRALKVDFSDLTLLRKVQAQALPRTRLRQWLLAAARSAVVLLLIAAYAGPVLQARGSASQGTAAGTGDGIDLVLLLDRSYSMSVVSQGRTRWSAVRASAETLLRSLRPADRVACAAFDEKVEGTEPAMDWMSPRACQDLIDRSPPGSRGTDYAPALRAAYALLGRSRRERAVLLLSDGAAHGLRGALPQPEPGIGLYCLSWPPPPFNATVLSARPERESSSDQPALRVVLWASAKADSSLDLWQDRIRLGASAVALKSRSETTASVPLPAGKSGTAPVFFGHLELRPDALSADDAYYYSFRQPRRCRLLVLYGDPAFMRSPHAGFFLQDLFAGPGKRILQWQADFAESARIGSPGLKLADYDAVALAGAQSLGAPAAAALEAYVRQGGGLWLFPGSREAPAPGELSRWLPFQASAAAEPEPERGLRVEPGAGGIGGSAGTGRTDFLTAGLAFSSWRGFELDKVALTRSLDLQPRSGGKVWIRTLSGAPLLVSAGHGTGRVAAWAAPLDVISGNLPVKPVFAALVSSTLSLLHESSSGVEVFDVKVGEPIVRTWTPQEAAPARVAVRSPEGRVATLWVKGRRVEYTATERPGLYAMEDESGSRVYAVNLDRSTGESDLAPAGTPAWRELDVEHLREEFWLKVRGRDARGAALGAAAAFLILEMLLCIPRAFVLVLLLVGLSGPSEAQQGDRFVWTQLKLGATWDPYPDAPAEILQLLGTVTSVLVETQRRVITLKDPELFTSPLIVLAGREAPPPLDAEDVRRLRAYLTAGGMLWIEDTSGLAESSFDRWVRSALKSALPESELQPLPGEHVVFKTFFLLRGVSGRVMVRGTLEGVSWGERAAVVYSRDDLLGAWVKDALGRPLLPCIPGGEAQRHNARKLTLDILMYSLTGSYKADAVHQPYLLMKMRQGIP